MSDALDLFDNPEVEDAVMLIGWKQWADAGSLSSLLPKYLIEQTRARKIGSIRADGFYLFQVPGTHDLVRPVVKYNEGYPESLDIPSNDFYYAKVEDQHVIYFLGIEPHMDVDRYIMAILSAAKKLNVRQIVGFGGVYAELPYDKERTVSASYSLPHLKDNLTKLAVNFSNYHGGASIGAYICRRAGDENLVYYGLYALVPTYDFSEIAQIGNTLRLEQDHMAWYGVMRRVNYLIKTQFNLTDLEAKSQSLIRLMNARVDQLDNLSPQAGVRAYFEKLSDEFDETIFDPLDDVWESELNRLLGDDEGE